jgi:predicted Rossmann fold flavoprotein
MGVKLKREETGKMFPVTDRARTVLDALFGEANRAGVELMGDFRVESVLGPRASGLGSPAPLEIRGPRPEARGLVGAKRVILATGGRSVPRTGSDGHGYDIARSLGHTVTPAFPALVPLIIDEKHWIRALSGTSAEVELSVRGESGRIIRRERGSMLMTHFGVSGPVVLDISRHWIAARGRLFANFLPGETFESLDRRLVAIRNPRATISSVLRGSVPERVLEKLAPAEPIARLPREVRRNVVRDLVELEIPVTGDRGFDYAEVTAGGVPLDEIDLRTMRSRIVPSVFLCGEILDVDGKIGGYNFQWAWASGRLAGMGAGL